MRTIKVETDELLKSLEDLSIIRIRFGFQNNWMLFPIIASNGEFLDIMVKKNSKKYIANKSGKVVMKYKKEEYEYILAGKIIKKDEKTSIFTISVQNAMKYRNKDYEHRFETRLNGSISLQNDEIYSGVIENISAGGVKIMSSLEVDLSADISLSINFNGGTLFKSLGRVLRKRFIEDNFYEYGVKFTNMKLICKNTLSTKIKELQEKCEYVSHEYRITNISGHGNSSSIATLSYGVEYSDYIEKALIKTGARNNYIVGSYGALKTSIFEENPYLIIIDGISVAEDIIFSTISKLMNNFQALNIIAIVPIDSDHIRRYFSKIKEGESTGFENKLDILYYPLVNGELEEIIIKYL